jgi:hypothetical protein
MAYCQSHSLVKDEQGTLQAATLKCHCWTCPNCVKSRQSGLKRLARAGNPDLFLTLTTSKETDPDPDRAAALLTRAWRLVVKRAKRHFKWKHLPYFTVIEAQKNGMPHLHILLRSKYIPQKWISEQLAELINAPIVYIERIHNPRRMAAYVAKYVGKAPHKFANCKRYWRSLDWIMDREKWDEEHQKAPGLWRIHRYALSTLEDILLKQGYAISWTRADSFEAEPGSGGQNAPP